MYYLPPKWLAYTCLNFTVCDFVGRTHNCTKSNTARLLWALTLSFITPLKTGHNQQRYHEKELVESLVRNTEGFLLFGHNPDPVFSLSREAAMYSFALAPRKSIKPSWSLWERWSPSKSPSSRERGCPILPLLQQNSGLCRVVIPPPRMRWRSVIWVAPRGRSLFSAPFCASCFPRSLVPPTSLPWSRVPDRNRWDGDSLTGRAKLDCPLLGTYLSHVLSQIALGSKSPQV